MERFICNISVILPALILCGCITEFEAKDIDEVDGLLVVEGIITDDESVITLSRSKGLSYEDNIYDLSPYGVTDAKVYIECDDGTQWGAVTQNLPPDLKSGGQYVVKTGKLNPARQYRLKIYHEAHEYCSEYLYPVITSDIDSVFWTKSGTGYPVKIHVAAHAPDTMVHYYRWSYREEWEIKTIYPPGDLGECGVCKSFYEPEDIFCPNCGAELPRTPYYCWKTAHNREILLGSTEKTVLGRVAAPLAEMRPTDSKMYVLYRMDVYQNAIRKQAFDYFTNIKKNARQAGSLFTQIPSELKGNIACTTDPARTVIGYMDVSSAARMRLWISRLDDAYEWDIYFCKSYSLWNAPLGYVYLPWIGFVHESCTDCRYGGATKYRPADWPDADTFNRNKNEKIDL